MRSSTLRRCLVLFAIGVLGLGGGAVQAQTAPDSTPAPKKMSKPHSVSGSPLDTFRSTHLWTETAPPKDFVKDSRPELKSLDYAPLTGIDPERPKPRDAANVAALQAELERARGTNVDKGRAFGRTSNARGAAR